MSQHWNTGITYSQLTDVGMRRANNQDSLASLPASTPERFLHRGHLFLVADGMGAHAAGELASRLAVEHIAMQYFRSTSTDSAEALRSAVSQSNAEIFRRGQQNPEFFNMGTTASSLALLPTGAIIAHVGDSRVYRLRKGILEQMTFDHSLVWEFEASGQVDPDSMFGQSLPKNVITRSLGPSEVVEVDLEGPFEIQAGDQFLLCSDGLSGQVEDEEIATLMDCLPEDQATRVLVDLANLRGGPDNSTVIIIRVEADFAGNASEPKRGPKKTQPSVLPLLLGTVVVCLLGAFGFGMAAWLVEEEQAKHLRLMVVALILGLIATAVCIVQFIQNQPKVKSPPLSKTHGGSGPYRRYSAQPTKELYDRLGSTVDELRTAASERNWMMNWKKIDQLQKKGRESLAEKDFKKAIGLQAEAIIETMHQLRELNNRAANETAIDL